MVEKLHQIYSCKMAKEECIIFLSSYWLKLNFGTFYRRRLKDVLFIQNKQDTC